MHILVTGGAGYFGTLLTDELLEQGHKVRVFDINGLDEPRDGVEVVRGDIRDLDSVRSACRGIDIVHHNVAQVPLAKDKELFHAVNYGGTSNLLNAALDADVGKVVYTSSSAVFGVPESNPVNDETVPTPMEAYGKAKYEAEHLCRDFAAKGLDVSIVRPRTIMGHGRLGIFQILFEWVREGYNVPVLGRGDNVYQFVHANDLATACIKAGEKSGPETFNVGAEEFGTMREVLENLCAHAGTGSSVRALPMAPIVFGMKLTSWMGLSPLGAYHALMYGRSMYFDIQKPKAALQWAPRYSNNEMFVESYDWYLKHREEVMSKKGGSHHKSAVNQRLLGLVKYLL
jgi:nucleoside-diphosphate-sugar epimerase